MAIGDTREIKLDDVQQKSLVDILTEYEPVGMSEGYMIVQERGPITLRERAPRSYMRELGNNGQTQYGAYWAEEYNPDLRGMTGLQRYDQMRRSDATVRASLRLKKLPIFAGTWFVRPASRKTNDINAAKLVWRCFSELMSLPHEQFLMEASTFIDFGHSVFEKVFLPRTVDGAYRITWKKLASRSQFQIMGFNYDETGGPDSIEFYSHDPARVPTVKLPIEKALVFSHDKENGNLGGISALRSAYKPWYFKTNLEKIDAIQKERHGVGIPVIKLPINFTKVAGPNGEPSDLEIADEIGRNLRVNEKAHVVLPPMWDLLFAKIEGYPVNPLESIQYHDRQIMVNVLGHDPLDADQAQEWFLSTSQDVVTELVSSINHYAVRQLVDYNYERVGYPRIGVRMPTNWRDWSFTLRNLVGADIIRPDEPFEEFVRQELELPDRDPDSDRVEELRKREEDMQGEEFQHEEDMAEEQQKAQAQAAKAAARRTPGQTPDSRTKSNGTRPGLPRQSPTTPKGTGSSRVGSASNNRA